MKMKILLLLAVAVVTNLSAQTGPAAKPITIGVLNVAGPRRTMANNIVSLFTANLSADERFALVDREELNKILAEQALGKSGNITPDTASKIGLLSGAKILITGREFMPSGHQVVIIANVIGTENGRVFSMTTQGADSNLV
ncbi:MAG TPA: CsgG/HfaB family protein, partial [Candidatus Cybelea sp.]|nr:CsgG/HfaB family protein [Candidatus Cybelea sp.]